MPPKRARSSKLEEAKRLQRERLAKRLKVRTSAIKEPVKADNSATSRKSTSKTSNR